MGFIADIENMFASTENKSGSIFVKALANCGGNLNEETCRDIFNLECIKDNQERIFTICKLMIENNCFVELAIDKFAETLCENPELCVRGRYDTLINDIISHSMRIRLSNDDSNKPRDCLELMYALGNHSYTYEIIRLYKRADTSIKAKVYSPETVQTKLAILAYNSNKYNATDNIRQMSELFQYIEDTKLKSMKGAAYYYHGVFYERTGFKKRYIALKSKEYYNSIVEGCIQSARHYKFWLADYFEL